ncbi:hypothetical protein B0H15DRAFT_463133 [Mycena belliarum]|uniref:Uncharacterized protein n=1 Tax=Mycena belliarum TaxID=1033014 RepID=A0AAD6XSX0_9AGAR|nr:hypothetical protein B0H15DRAFT_463133 [Mycena belliae]
MDLPDLVGFKRHAPRRFEWWLIVSLVLKKVHWNEATHFLPSRLLRSVCDNRPTSLSTFPLRPVHSIFHIPNQQSPESCPSLLLSPSSRLSMNCATSSSASRSSPRSLRGRSNLKWTRSVRLRRHPSGLIALESKGPATRAPHPRQHLPTIKTRVWRRSSQSSTALTPPHSSGTPLTPSPRSRIISASHPPSSSRAPSLPAPTRCPTPWTSTRMPRTASPTPRSTLPLPPLGSSPTWAKSPLTSTRATDRTTTTTRTSRPQPKKSSTGQSLLYPPVPAPLLRPLLCLVPPRYPPAPSARPSAARLGIPRRRSRPLPLPSPARRSARQPTRLRVLSPRSRPRHPLARPALPPLRPRGLLSSPPATSTSSTAARRALARGACSATSKAARAARAISPTWTATTPNTTASPSRVAAPAVLACSRARTAANGTSARSRRRIRRTLPRTGKRSSRYLRRCRRSFRCARRRWRTRSGRRRATPSTPTESGRCSKRSTSRTRLASRTNLSLPPSHCHFPSIFFSRSTVPHSP